MFYLFRFFLCSYTHNRQSLLHRCNKNKSVSLKRLTKTYLMRSLYKLRLFEVILSKTAEFLDSQLSCWDFVADFAL